MLESGSALRHKLQETELFREIGIDLSARSDRKRTSHRVLCEWIGVAGDERPAIIEKLAAALANRMT